MHQRHLHAIGLCLVLVVGLAVHADSASNRAELLQQFGDTVYEAPATHSVPERDQGNIKAIFYDALPYKGKPTRAFAYLGIPDAPEGKKLPAMVLAHGGGGTAFHDWVKIWNDKGYVAISMDLTGHLPEGSSSKRGDAHEFSGPNHTGMFDDQDKPRDQQWMYHAVADIMLANSLLRSLDTVDAEHIGLTGISWGGVLSSLTAGLDDRFVFAAPVYGCGYLYDSKGYFNRMGAKDDATLEKRKYWDPARFFTDAPIPMLWINGDNDPHFSVDTMNRSHISAGAASTLSIHHRMPHGHSPAWLPEKVPAIYALADYLLKGQGTALARIAEQPKRNENGAIVMRYESQAPIVGATLYWRTTPIAYADNKKKLLDLVQQWQQGDATLDTAANTVTVNLPEGCTQYYINLTDDRGCIISSNLSTVK